MLPCAHPALLSYWESVFFSLECDRTWYSADFLFSALTFFYKPFDIFLSSVSALVYYLSFTQRTDSKRRKKSLEANEWIQKGPQLWDNTMTGSSAQAICPTGGSRSPGRVWRDRFDQSAGVSVSPYGLMERERNKTIEYCWTSCSELGHDQSKLKCSFSYSLSLHPVLFSLPF